MITVHFVHGALSYLPELAAYQAHIEGLGHAVGHVLRRDTPRLANPFANDAQNLGQVLGPNDQERDEDNKQKFGRGDVKHSTPPVTRA